MIMISSWHKRSSFFIMVGRGKVKVCKRDMKKSQNKGKCNETLKIIEEKRKISIARIRLYFDEKVSLIGI